MKYTNIKQIQIKTQVTRGWPLNRVHNSRRPLDRLQYVFALCDPVTLIFDLSTPKSYHLQDIPRSFPTPSLNTFGSFLFELSCRQTDRHTDRQTDADERFTAASNDNILILIFCKLQEVRQRRILPSHIFVKLFQFMWEFVP